MKRILLLAAAVLSLAISCGRGVNDTYTVVVSLDGFRHDYPEIFSTPFLHEMETFGVRATMSPSYPASTFPNHYTLATGLVPDHNGIVNGKFWDDEDGVMYKMGDSLTRNNPKYYLGEPVWNTAEKQGVRTAVLYWVGSDIPGMDHPSSYRYWYDTPRLSYDERADEVVRLMSLPEEERPRLVMAYFDEPDGAGHKFGPDAEGTGVIVEYMDSLMREMYTALKALPHGDRINLVILSDHGMTAVSDDRKVDPEEFIKPEWCERIIWSNPVNIWPAENCCDSIVDAFRGVPHVRAYRKADIPAELCYGTSPRLGEVVLIPDLGWTLTGRDVRQRGNHGYDPDDSDMQVIFCAAGPSFKSGVKCDAHFRNVDIYPLICHLLGIKPEKTDGILSRISPVLK